MALTDILLHLPSYPTGPSAATVDEAVKLITGLCGEATALAIEVQLPVKSNPVADYLIGLTELAHQQEADSRAACRASLERFTAKATEAGVSSGALLGEADLYDLPDHVARLARTRDLCLLPLDGGFDGQRDVAECVLFSSGRPIVAFEPGTVRFVDGSPNCVVLAWDGSACAARAMADAMPVLVQAKKVRLLTVLQEKPVAVAGLSVEAQRHLATHGVAATIDEIDAAGRSIGEALDAYLARLKPDLLVMGAFGHSRLREFVLGGATRHMLRRPPVPVFMTH